MKSLLCNKRDHKTGRYEAKVVVSRGRSRGRGHCHQDQGRDRGQYFGPRGWGRSEDLASL